MSGQSWTPAPKKGIIPLHPLTFGMLLGKAFAALRHNPKVLFGFAVALQLMIVILTTGVMTAVLVTTFTRLQTVPPSSPDFEAVLAGTIAINIVSGLALGLASLAFTAAMQGVVAADVGFAATGRKASLGALWRQMRPAFWRLVGFASLSVVALFGLFAVIAGVIFGFVAGGLGSSAELIGLVVIIAVLIGLASIPLVVWLSTKLLLVPSILVLEHATFRAALVRSWRLTRGRFWVAFGVTFLISAIMGLAMQVVSLPVTLLGGVFGSILAPTGEPDAGAVIGLVFTILAPQILLLILQAVTLVVQSTGAALVYLDCRMRYEGLDQALISYVERRDLGWTEEQLGDPFVVDPARAVSSAPPPRQLPEHAMLTVGYGYPAPYPAQYPAPGQPYSAVPAPPYPGYAPAPQYPAPQHPAPYAPAPPVATPPPAPAPPATPVPPTDSPWAPPGSGSA